jgi:hypothetical protein
MNRSTMKVKFIFSLVTNTLFDYFGITQLIITSILFVNFYIRKYNIELLAVKLFYNLRQFIKIDWK